MVAGVFVSGAAGAVEVVTGVDAGGGDVAAVKARVGVAGSAGVVLAGEKGAVTQPTFGGGEGGNEGSEDSEDEEEGEVLEEGHDCSINCCFFFPFLLLLSSLLLFGSVTK